MDTTMMNERCGALDFDINDDPLTPTADRLTTVLVLGSALTLAAP